MTSPRAGETRERQLPHGARSSRQTAAHSCDLSSRHAMEFYLGSVACLQKAMYPAKANQLFTAQQIAQFRAAFDSFDGERSAEAPTYDACGYNRPF